MSRGSLELRESESSVEYYKNTPVGYPLREDRLRSKFISSYILVSSHKASNSISIYGESSDSKHSISHQQEKLPSSDYDIDQVDYEMRMIEEEMMLNTRVQIT